MSDRELQHYRKGVLFARLAPPPGGEQRLRAAVQRQRDRPLLPAPRLALAAAALLALVAGALLLAPRGPSPIEQALAAAQRPAELQVAHGAALELPSSDARVRLYVVTARKVVD